MVADSHAVVSDLPMGGNGQALVAVEGLTKRFPVSKSLFRQASSFIHAVEDVSFSLAPGESLGLVGEPGAARPRWASCW